MDRLAATLLLDEPVQRIRLVSPARAHALEGLGISTVRDLLTHFPRRYIDLSALRTIAQARIGEQCTVCATVHAITLKRPKPKLTLVEIALVDASATLVVTAFRQPWLVDRISAGDRIAVAGEIEFNYGYKRMTNPFIEVLDDASEAGHGVIIPVHPACEKISTALMRRIVENALEQCEGMLDPLPLSLRTRFRLMSRNAALRAIHFPERIDDASQARRRLAFEEVLLLELSLMMHTDGRAQGQHPVEHTIDGPRMRTLASSLPFALTEDQARARAEVLDVLSAPRCANHLVLGDVGTGKTIVAAFAVAAAADTGCQCMLMVPTEVLARQHASSLGVLFDACGITWELLCGSTAPTEREAIVARFAAGTIDVLIGTHALIEPDVRPAKLSLAIIDEQQRFGVEQRSALLEKGDSIDALYLTATPIPRTLALALYGDLTLSYLIQKPHGTPARKTIVLTRTAQGEAYDAALAALKRGEQVFVVCPLVGQGPTVHEQRAEGGDAHARAADGVKGNATSTAKAQRTYRREAGEGSEEDRYEFGGISIETESDYSQGDVKAAATHVDMLRNGPFCGYEVALLHGKMATKEKDEVMERFRAGSVHVLVSTTVIEVGVDVPNATVMIVEDADRFGLSQLHQLRGRVGRGEKPGEVYLISNSHSEASCARLGAMERTEDGFELANYDLSLRREGDILGNRQHGAATLKLVNVVRDGAIIEAAHGCARAMLEEDPQLESREHAALAREVRLMLKGGAIKQGG